MDLYPIEYMCHNLPLMTISGLVSPRQLSANRINTSGADIPVVVDEAFPYASELLHAFSDGSDGSIWDTSAERSEKYRQQPIFRVVAVKREYQFPLKKASPLSPRSTISVSSTSSKTAGLHSPLSPLSPESPLYPDGFITQFWLRKYREQLPSVFVGFYEIYTQTEDVQIKIAKDSELIKELSDQKKLFYDRGVKFSVVIVSRKTILQSIDLNDRIAYLRKNTGLDARSGLFFLPPSSVVEINVFAKEVKAATYSAAIDFYNNLLKHARRKKGHNGTSLVSVPGAPVLSSQGWNVRYEFKQAVFAEYRQDIELAIKLYGVVYESLLGLIESISPLSTRWNETRTLLDSIAFKILKCNLYLNQPIVAQKVFNVHLQSVASLIEKIFSTTEVYSFYNWKALQYQILAQLLEMVPEFVSPRSLPFASNPTVVIEPDFPSENLLHHAGFQYLEAARMTIQRRALCKFSSGESVDLYMSIPADQERDFNHAALIVNLLESAYSRFDAGDGIQTRFQAQIALQIARIYFESEDFVSALKYFRLAEGVYRREKWLEILGWIITDSITAANRIKSADDLVKLQFEYLAQDLAPWNTNAKGFDKFLPIDLGFSSKSEYVIDSTTIVSFISTSFAFMKSEVFISSEVRAQLTMQSRHIPSVPEIQISHMVLFFTGSLKQLVIEHEPSIEPSSRFRFLELTEEDERFTSKANLSFLSDQIKTFEFSFTVRRIEHIEASKLILVFTERDFDLKLMVDLTNIETNDWIAQWFTKDESLVTSQKLSNIIPRRLSVKPKAPHLNVFSALKGPAYVNETLLIPITIQSEESEDIKVLVTSKVLNIEGQLEFKVEWVGFESADNDTIDIGIIKAGSDPVTVKLSLMMPSETCDLVVDTIITYQLLSDPEVDITKTFSLDMPVIVPFQLSYEISPQIHPDKWPSPFFIYDLESHSPQITKRWCLSITIDAVDMTHLVVEDYDFDLTNAVGVDTLLIEDGAKGLLKGRKDSDVYTHTFLIDTTNNDAIERRLGTVDALFTLRWKRKILDENEGPTTIYVVPPIKLTFPLLEPRVFVDVVSVSSEVVHLVYFIENATSHFLSFSVTLDVNTDMTLSYPIRQQLRHQAYTAESSGGRDSDDLESSRLSREKQLQIQHANFNYEGAKQVGVRVLPYTSRRLDYDLLPLAVTFGWQRLPSLRVFDTHFKKALNVIPGSEKFRIDIKTGAVYLNISQTEAEDDKKVSEHSI
ncbi:Gryzun, putative trafficking through golgi-domain-containing protein [Lipomyces oligophaga]|uniref:Gryzun, putative trafficking through golgi-domain-containing protein n=1 Tax=Lipomyces oligophaga TaxID=45792 RepID=UPI0034CD85BE